MNIKAAIFDMDGTLIDSLIFWNLLWKALGETYLGDPGFLPSPEVDKEVRTLTLDDAMALIHRTYGIGSSAEALAEEAKCRIRRFYAEQVQVKPGAKEFLAHLKEQGVPMCIASGTDRELVLLAADRCGIAEYFSGFFSCATIGKGKDQPDIYLQALEFLGTAAEETWVFEDSLVALETAASLGMPLVAVYDPNNFGHEKMQQLAVHYIGPDQTLASLT